MSGWTFVCDEGEIDPEDVIRFDHGGRSYAVYRSATGEAFATDGFCTHEGVHLADGLVMGEVIECPKHNGRFNYKTGLALRAPVCEALVTYPARVIDGRIEIAIGAEQ